MLLFIIKSAITLALLYSCFFFLLSKETFHRLNRFMLLGIMVVSLIAPLFHFTTENPTLINEEFYQMETIIEEGSMPIFMTPQIMEQAPRITWVQVLTWLYLAGVAVMVVLTLIQAISLIRLMRGGLCHTDAAGNTVVLLKGDIPPFSIFRFIVMSVKDYENSRSCILTHEQEHIRLGHTYDLLLLEAMKILQWFNPFVWFISRDLKVVHEYEADQAVIRQGIDAKTYQQLLVTKVVGNRLQPFTNNLNHGSLKKRIFMMYQKPSNRWLMLKALCAIPVAVFAISAFATPATTESVEEVYAKLENTEVPVLNEAAKADAPARPVNDDGTPFAIHPVRDQYGRVVGFSHEGEPAEIDKDFNCTCEYVFINDRPATEEEVRNYKSILSSAKWSMVKTPNGTARFNYKDKKGVICIMTDQASNGQAAEEVLFVVDGEEARIAGNFRSNILNDEVIAEAIGAKVGDIESITVLKDAAAIAIYGEKGKNGVIEIKTKKASAVMRTDSLVARLPGVVKNADGSITINGKTVKKISVDGQNVYTAGTDSLVARLPGAVKNADGSITINGKTVKKISVDGQNVYTAGTDEVLTICDEMPQFPGGNAALIQYLSQNLRYPESARENGIQGRIVISFIVNKDGSCSDFQVARNAASNAQGVLVTTLAEEAKKKMQEGAQVEHTPEALLEMGKALENEALRVLGAMPFWAPGKQQGQPVCVKYTTPVVFRLR